MLMKKVGILRKRAHEGRIGVVHDQDTWLKKTRTRYHAGDRHGYRFPRKYEGRMSSLNTWGRGPEGSGIVTNFTHRLCMLLSTPTT